MTAPVPTPPVVKAALVDLIRSQVADPSVMVSYDAATKRRPFKVIEVGVPDTSADFSTAGMVGSGGAGWLQEQYVVAVKVTAFRTGDQAAEVDADAWTLAAAVIAAVRADPSLGGLVAVARPLHATQTGDQHSQGTPPAQGRRSEIEVPIRITSVI